MVLNTVKITGTFNFPDASWTQHARAVFILSGFDTDTGVVTPDLVTVNLGPGGELDVDLWPNTAGLRGTIYRVYVDLFTDESYSKLIKRLDFGRIQISGPANIANLLDAPVLVPGFWYSTITLGEYNQAIDARDIAVAAADAAASAAGAAAASASAASDAAASAGSAAMTTFNPTPQIPQSNVQSAIEQVQANAATAVSPVPPANPVPGGFWLDTSVSPAVLRQRSADNTTWLRLSTPRTLHNTLPANFSTTSGTFQNIGLSQAITPASASNHMLITLSIYAFASRGTHHLNVVFEIMRDTTVIGNFPFDHVVGGATLLFVPIPMHFTLRDSPNTTRAITYSVRARNALTGNEATVFANRPSTITVQEIAG